jgi:formylglycine-generating enzyme required for sulfatase activity
MEDLIRVPAGRVTVKGLLNAEVPEFWIDRLIVTYRLFSLYCKANRLNDVPEWNRPMLWSHPDQPMTNVTFDDCEAFCRWRSRLSGRKYRLPTQEEWLRAALGDDGRTYPWGNSAPNYKRAAYAVVRDSDAVPPPVGQFPAGASPFGALDMAGTVWELTSSHDQNGKVIFLGGSCDCEAYLLTPSRELFLVQIPDCTEDRSDPQMGFRCVAEVAGHD